MVGKLGLSARSLFISIQRARRSSILNATLASAVCDAWISQLMGIAQQQPAKATTFVEQCDDLAGRNGKGLAGHLDEYLNGVRSPMTAAISTMPSAADEADFSLFPFSGGRHDRRDPGFR